MFLSTLFIVRLSLLFHLVHHIHPALNQHEAAVELALKIDTDLAASCAAGKMARQPLPEETSKKLWLKVMRRMMILKRMMMMIVMKQVVVV